MLVVLLFIPLIAPVVLAESSPVPVPNTSTGGDMVDQPVAAGSSVRSLAEQGDANAQWLLATEQLAAGAESHAERDGMRWLRRAADQGHSLAQRDLGIRYELGHGVGNDLTEAFFWYALASRRDSGGARARRDALLPALTQEQLDTVTARLGRWRPTRIMGP